MYRTPALIVVLVLVAGTGLGALQGFQIRPGQWEYTVTITATPEDIPNSVTGAARKALLDLWAHPQVVRDCVTPEDVAQGQFTVGDDEDDDCATTSRTATATSLDLTRTCKGDRPRTETVHVSSTDREHMQMSIARVKGSGGPARLTVTARWVGAACRD